MLSLSDFYNLASFTMPFRNMLNILPEIDKACQEMQHAGSKLVRFNMMIKRCVQERRDLTKDETDYVLGITNHQPEDRKEVG